MKMSLGLTFPGTLQDEAVICTICKRFEVNLNIIEASFSITAGWAILQIEGSEPEIEKVFQYLKECDIHIQQIEKKGA